MMDEAEVGGRREDERAVASAQDSPLFSYIAGQWHRVSGCKREKVTSGCENCLLKVHHTACCSEQCQASSPSTPSATPAQHSLQKGSQIWSPSCPFVQEQCQLPSTCLWHKGRQLIWASFNYWDADFHNTCMSLIILENSASCSKLVETSQQTQKLWKEKWERSWLMTVGHSERKRRKILTNGILARKLMNFSLQSQASSGTLTALWAQESHLSVI